MSKTTVTTPSVLAFERKLDPSDALFSAGKWDDRKNGPQWLPIRIREKSVRGTISNRLKTKDQDPAKMDAAIENANLQTVDVATLPNDLDTLRLRFTLRVLGGAGIPSACNSAAYLQKLEQTVQTYVDKTGFGALARRYAINLANGRFLWRNRLGAEQIVVEVRHLVNGEAEKSWCFNALEFSLRDFSVPQNAESDIQQLADSVAAGLAGKTHTLLEVIAYARMGDGQEVFPSQALILDKGDKKGQKSKTLYKVNEVAALHSQKVGNALRTIDTWYPVDEAEKAPEGAEARHPIAVEVYGSVTNQGKAYRQPRGKSDFYALLDAWVLNDKEPEPSGNPHYVMAMLIRGGVFGEGGKE